MQDNCVSSSMYLMRPHPDKMTRKDWEMGKVNEEEEVDEEEEDTDREYEDLEGADGDDSETGKL